MPLSWLPGGQPRLSPAVRWPSFTESADEALAVAPVNVVLVVVPVEVTVVVVVVAVVVMVVAVTVEDGKTLADRLLWLRAARKMLR